MHYMISVLLVQTFLQNGYVTTSMEMKMSKEDAPLFGKVKLCFMCKYCISNLNHDHYCSKYEFMFKPLEAFTSNCDECEPAE